LVLEEGGGDGFSWEQPYEAETGMMDHNYCMAAMTGKSGDATPLTYEDAISSPNKEKWIEAMYEEIKSLDKNKVWTIVD
jgi:hypothetical protein